MSCGPAVVSYSCRFVQVCVFFDPLVDPLSFNNVRFAAVIVTHDVVDGSRGVLLVLVFCLYGVLSSNGEC